MRLFVTSEHVNTEDWLEYKECLSTPLDLPFSSVAFEYEIEHGIGGEIKCLLGAVERGFNSYTMFSVVLFKDGRLKFDWYNDDGSMNREQERTYVLIKNTLRACCAYLKESRIAEDPQTLNRVKILKEGRKKKVYPISSVTYIVPKKNTVSFERKMGRSFDWSHSFEVRGHWRKIKGIGKDREGQYCINGFTWVSPSVKGKGDLVKKIRVIK